MVAFFEQFVDGLIASLPNVLTALVIFIASLYVARLVSGLLRRAMQRLNSPLNVTNLLAQLARWVVIIIGTITALERFFEVTAFLAGLGIIGFTVGFALQDVMKNFAAGIILLVQRPFGVGDVIGVIGFDGTVLEINLRTTEMKALDGRIVTLPNADVLSHPIINYTRADRRRVDLTIGVDYDSDTELVRTLVFQSIQDVPGYVAEPAPLVGFSNFGNLALELNASFWIDMQLNNPPAAKDTALLAIKNAFDKKKISIPLMAAAPRPAAQPPRRQSKG